MTSVDDKVELQVLSFEAPKLRLLRSVIIETETRQVSFSEIPSSLAAQSCYKFPLLRLLHAY